MGIKSFYHWILIICCAMCLTAATGDKDQHLPHYYVEKTKQLFDINQWGEGKKLLDEGLKFYPDDPDMRWLMGRYFYQYKDYDKARYHLIKAVEYDYNHVLAKQLLVNVEEDTKHYSSAICYVNELLEVNPYWRGLWRRKIELYRKQGNDVEADHLLRRISQIYPEDRVLRNDLNYALENSYRTSKKKGDLKEATTTLEELMKTSPANEQYFLDLTNLYLQQGQTEKALETAGQGAQMIPGSGQLVMKKVGILSEQYRYPEAMAFVREQMKHSRSASLQRVYNELMVEAAAVARDNDPYVLYGKIYEQSKSKEALDFLLATSLSRGYVDDARFYLHEAKKHYGSNTDLLYKEYVLEKREGNEREANNLLEKLYAKNPKNYDVALAISILRMREAEKLMLNGDWTEALPYAKFAMKSKYSDSDTRRSAMEKIITCYTQMKRYNEALAILDSLHSRFPEYVSYTDKKASLLDKMGRTEDALSLYAQAIQEDTSGLRKEMYVAAYEEMAIPYIKRLMQDGSIRSAYNQSMHLLAVNPTSDLGLHYAINSAYSLGNFSDFSRFTEIGRRSYPNDVFYKVKEATLLDHDKKYYEAINLIKPELYNYPNSLELIGAHSLSSEHWAKRLILDDKEDSALAVLDSALVFDANNRDLKYTKGLAYEKLKMYDSAYVYQKFYQPSVAEVGEYNQHMRGLLNKNYKNEVGLEYLHSRLANEDVISSIATAEYSRKETNDIYTARVNYKGLDGNYKYAAEYGEDSITGGTGIQLQAEWQHKFTPKLTGMANIAWASKYFPKWTMNVQATLELKHEWEASLKLGYRRVDLSGASVDDNGNVSHYRKAHNMFILTPGISKTWYPLWADAKLDIIFLQKNIYYNLNGQARFYLNDDGRTNISAMAGIGSFPEISLIDRSLLQGFSHTNTMVGLGGQFLLTRHLTLGVLGTWYTYYNQYYNQNSNSTTSYKNLYNVYVSLFINF